ncbi:PTS mannose transporter subunit IID [Virgibacillus sp. C22-A2]|uniref:PTS mannose transporter subunit IID n=1 Tax=Virgibacillus tibetensis TaxID=3042313 RepID=A0ABU6KC58_9BACI|nr:PTS mannose transporter subunit IID [Virgibacillus sp. C22-A2]
MKDKAKEISILIVGFFTSVMGFLATLNVKFEWLTEASVNAFGAVIVSGVILVGSLYAVYKNTFVITAKAKIQAEELQKKGLK